MLSGEIHVWFFGHGKNMKRWQYRLVSNCPCCGEMEDKAHITQCQQDLAAEIWDLAFKKLKQWFQVSNTWHKVADAILWCLSQWHGTALASDCPILHSVLDQELLGWDWLLDGWVVQSWTEYQEHCWALVWSHCSGKCWVAELIKKLWNVSWDMWAHWNGILHNAEILEEKVNNTIVDLYALGTQALPRDAMKLMHKSQEHMLWLPLKVKQQWIESVQVAWQQKTQHDYGQYLSEQRFMAKWVIYL